MRRALLSFALVWLLLPLGSGVPEMTEKKGRIYGESHVNLRSGPDLSHPAEAVLRRGEEVVVEGEEGSWYLVSLVDGRKGYVHKTLVRLLRTEQTVKVTGAEGVTKAEEKKKDLGIPRAEGTAEPTPKDQRLPVIKLLEGRGWEVLWWLGIGLCIFIIGWICGGHYYLRRDRIKRSKLRF